MTITSEMLLGDLCEFSAGNAFKTKFQGASVGDHPFIKVSDFELSGNQYRIHNANNWVSNNLVNEQRYKLHKAGSVVFAKIGVALTSNRRRLITRDTIIDNNLMTAVGTNECYEHRYLFYVLSSLDFNLISSGSAIPYLTVKDLNRIIIPKHSSKNQKAIAHILGTLDDKIELNQKMNQTLEEIAKAIFKSWFVDFDPVRAKAEGRPTGLPPEISELFPDELVDSEIGEIPAGWEVNPLGSVFVIQYGKNLPTNNLIEKGYPVFGGNGVIGFHSKYLYEEVMTLIACRGAASGKVGRSLPKSFVTNNSLVINHQGAGVTSQRFIEFILANGATENYVTGSAQPQLTIDNIKNFPFITPSSEVVDSFQGIVNPLADRQLLLDSESQVLSELRETLLPKLISGELRIPDAEKFLEEEGI